jgi:diacylglycerol kinase family enzyme
VLVSNTPSRTDDPFGLGRRDRLDAAVLGVLGIRVDNAAEAAGLLLDPAPGGLTILTAPEVVLEADRAEIEAGIDGEALVLPAPVHCRISPGALRVRVPRKRPGISQPVPRLDWRRLRKLAATVGRTAVHHRHP